MAYSSSKLCVTHAVPPRVADSATPTLYILTSKGDARIILLSHLMSFAEWRSVPTSA
jgi:hypothetical protein